MSDHQRLSPKERTEQILAAALEVASAKGFSNITRKNVAATAGCSVGLVTLRFATMPQLRRAVMRRAVAKRVLSVIGQGLAVGDPIAGNVPPKLKKEAVASLA